MQLTRNEGAGTFTLKLDSELQTASGYDFIDDMKELVHKSDRSYDSELKVWTIQICHYKAVRDLYQRYFVPANQLGLGI